MYNRSTFDSKKLPTEHRLTGKEARPKNARNKVSRNQRCTGMYEVGKRQRSIPNAPPARQKKDDACLS